MSNLLRLPEPAHARLTEALHARFPLWFNRSQRLRRWVRRLMFAVAFYVVGSWPAWAKDKWEGSSGIGSIITVPDLAKGHGKTLYESYSLGRYRIYTDLSWKDVAKSGAAILYQTFEWGALFLGKLAVGLTWWQVQLTGSESGLSEVGKGMQSAASTLNAWLLPSALAIGLAMAYVMARRGEDFFGQAAKCIACAVLAVGISISGAQMANYADQGRTMLSNGINAAGGGAVSTSDEPFTQPGTDVSSGKPADNAARAQGDAVWRVLIVVPWCQVQFGQQDVCKAVGHSWLENSVHVHDVKVNVLDKRISQGENGDDVAKYVKGNNPADRLIMSIIALLIAAVGCIILGGLALMAIMPWILVVLLLWAAVVFLCLACIPKTRPIATEYANTLFGLTLTSALTGTILTGMLMAMLAGAKITNDSGWLPGLLFTFACMGGAWVGRKKLEQILTGRHDNVGGMGMVASVMGGRMLSKGLGRMAGAVAGSAPGRAAGRGIRSAGGKLGGRVQRKMGNARANARNTGYAGQAARRAGAAGRAAFMARTKTVRGQASGWNAHLRDTAAGMRDNAKAWPGQKWREHTASRRDAKDQMRQSWADHKTDQRRNKLEARDERHLGRFDAIRNARTPAGGRGPGATRKNTMPTATQQTGSRGPASTHPSPTGPHGGRPAPSAPPTSDARRRSRDSEPAPAYTAPPPRDAEPVGDRGAARAQLRRYSAVQHTQQARVRRPQQQPEAGTTAERARRRAQDDQARPIPQQPRRSATARAEDVTPRPRPRPRRPRGEQ